MKKALLIIDVQVSCVQEKEMARKIEALQAAYDFVLVSQFVNKDSPLISLLDWPGYADDSLAFTPAPGAVVFQKNIYSSYLEEMKDFDEIHLCGFDTDACVYKTALDLVENGVRPVVLSAFCGSCDERFHQAGLELLKRNIGAHNVI